MADKKYEIFDELEKIGVAICDRRKYLFSELSKIDKERTDIEHFIEIYPLSASQGYKIAKKLQDCLSRRREIKNEIEVLNRISALKVCEIYKGKGANALAKLESKQYTPRILKDLFKTKDNVP